MNVEAINPYPPLIYGGHYDFTQAQLEAADEILQASKNITSHLELGNAVSSVAAQSVAPHRHEIFRDFFIWALHTGQQVLGLLNVSQPELFYIGNSWINRHGYGGMTLPHNHGYSGLSMVAYLNLPTNSGFTEFKDPHYDLKSLTEHSNELHTLKEFYPIRVRQNDVLFFPGWLTHRSGINSSHSDRIILSANFINFTHKTPLTLGDVYS